MNSGPTIKPSGAGSGKGESPGQLSAGMAGPIGIRPTSISSVANGSAASGPKWERPSGGRSRRPPVILGRSKTKGQRMNESTKRRFQRPTLDSYPAPIPPDQDGLPFAQDGADELEAPDVQADAD